MIRGMRQVYARRCRGTVGRQARAREAYDVAICLVVEAAACFFRAVDDTRRERLRVDALFDATPPRRPLYSLDFFTFCRYAITAAIRLMRRPCRRHTMPFTSLSSPLIRRYGCARPERHKDSAPRDVATAGYSVGKRECVEAPFTARRCS